MSVPKNWSFSLQIFHFLTKMARGRPRRGTENGWAKRKKVRRRAKFTDTPPVKRRVRNGCRESVRRKHSVDLLTLQNHPKVSRWREQESDYGRSASNAVLLCHRTEWPPMPSQIDVRTDRSKVNNNRVTFLDKDNVVRFGKLLEKRLVKSSARRPWPVYLLKLLYRRKKDDLPELIAVPRDRIVSRFDDILL